MSGNSIASAVEVVSLAGEVLDGEADPVALTEDISPTKVCSLDYALRVGLRDTDARTALIALYQLLFARAGFPVHLVADPSDPRVNAHIPLAQEHSFHILEQMC